MTVMRTPARFIVAVVLSCLLAIVPLAWNAAILRAAQPWIIVLFGTLASLLQPAYNPFTIAAVAGDRGTGAQIIWSVYIVQMAAVLEAGYLRYPESIAWDATAVIALSVAVAGLLFRTWAVLVLGEFFTMHLAVGEKQSVVMTGPYAIVRHPSYFGAFLLYAGIPVFLHSWYAAVAGAVILPFAFVRRILVEESMLEGRFGHEYQAYCDRTKRFLPGIW